MNKTDINCYIPCGFRCFTKERIQKKYNIKKSETLPFDNGFISPYSIKKMLDNKYIHLNLKNTTPCIKIDNVYEENNKRGIKFIESSYEEINKHYEKNGYDNRYLDSTTGYYTLLKDYGCVLAHYNWHKSSKFGDIYDPETNLKIIEETINRRINRLKNLIKNANTLYICYYEPENLEFMIINNERIDLSPNVAKEYLLHTFSRYEKKNIYVEFIGEIGEDSAIEYHSTVTPSEEAPKF